MIREYYQLAKPGIVYGNLLTAIGGFFLASNGHIEWRLFLCLVLGNALVIASACVFNNYRDSDIDIKMTRTSKRALASAVIADEHALIYGGILGLLGLALLTFGTNRLTVYIGILGLISYVWAYTSLKRKTEHATLVGSIPGATSIVAGYVAVTGSLDLGAVLLFLVMALWQMPHFYAIAMFRRDEYAAAGVPVLSVSRGLLTTMKYTFWYTVAFAVAVALLALYGYASFTFFIIMTGLSTYWLVYGYQGFKQKMDLIKWSRKMFGMSLIVLLVFSIMLSVDAWLP